MVFGEAILAEVPTLAIDEVLFTENSSPIYGEYMHTGWGWCRLRRRMTLKSFLRFPSTFKEVILLT